MQTRGLSEMTMGEIDAEIALVSRLDGRRHDDVSQATMPEVALFRFSSRVFRQPLESCAFQRFQPLESCAFLKILPLESCIRN